MHKYKYVYKIIKLYSSSYKISVSEPPRNATTEQIEEPSPTVVSRAGESREEGGERNDFIYCLTRATTHSGWYAETLPSHHHHYLPRPQRWLLRFLRLFLQFIIKKPC